MELNKEIIDKVNDLIGIDRSLLSKENTSELVFKLKNKINSLKDNFIVNLPHQYNEEGEFIKLCSKINNLKERLNMLKQEDEKIMKLVNSYKIVDDEGDQNPENSSYKDEIKALILKSICIQRYYCYIKCLIRLDEFSLKLDENFAEFVLLKERKIAVSNQEAKSTPKKITHSPTSADRKSVV